MRMLAQVFADSFAIWARNFALMYVLLFFSLLLVSIWPQGELPSWEPRWMLLVAVMALLTAAFMSGWFNMIATASHRYITRQKGKPMDVAATVEAFKLFGEFLPGVGRFFLPFALGIAIQGLVVFLLYLGLQDLISVNMNVFEKIAEAPPYERNAILTTLTPEELNRFADLALAMIGSMAVYGLYTLLTMFWPALVILYGHNVFKAFWLSIRQFFRDPWRILALGLFFLSAQLVLTLMMSLGAVMFIVSQFLALMLEIYMAVVLFVYIMAALGAPAETAAGASSETPEPADDVTPNP